MSKLKRYDFNEHFQALQTADNGLWVKYEDAQKLEAKIAELQERERKYIGQYGELTMSDEELKGNQNG